MNIGEFQMDSTFDIFTTFNAPTCLPANDNVILLGFYDIFRDGISYNLSVYVPNFHV